MPAPHRRSPPLSQVLRDPRLALMLALGFSSGLPFLLIFSTQSVWLREVGVSRSAIGLMSYAALAFAFKFAWAPIIDRFDPPGFGALLGRRRGWMLVAQIGVALGLAGLAFGDPAQTLTWNVAFAFLTAFAAATQDATIDGWRIDAAPTERQGMMAAIYQLGYRLAMLCAGAGALYIADFVSWRAAYLAMAGPDGGGNRRLPAVAAARLAAARRSRRRSRRSASRSPISSAATARRWSPSSRWWRSTGCPISCPA